MVAFDEDVGFEVVVLFDETAETITQYGVLGCNEVDLDTVENLLLGQRRSAETRIGHA